MDQTTDDEAELKRIEARIVELCRTHVTNGRTLLLSHLGKLLEDDLIKLKLLSRSSLTEFLTARLPAEFSVAAVGPHRNIYSIISTQPIEASSASLPDVLPATDSTKRRYHFRFWAAFAVPKTEAGDHRYIDLRTFLFRDTNDPPKADELEIDVSRIPASDMPNRDPAVTAYIEEWLKMHDLSGEQFSASAQKGHQPPLAHGWVSALELVLEALDHRQLQAVSLPLDAVASLLRKRIVRG